LALRNVLLTDGLVIKISDFGLSRQVEEDGAYTQDTRPELPFRWSAPEVLYGKPKTPIAADLWTFGILLWELFKLCSVPYETKNLPEIIAFINAGKRLDHPEYAPEEM
jgi:serine/threonine protein kinase